MSQPAEHCPFLNRQDERCARHLRLGRIGHMMLHCCGAYDECPTYVGLLIERQVKRGMAARPINTLPINTIGDDPRPRIQITLPPRRREAGVGRARIGRDSLVPALPGL